MTFHPVFSAAFASLLLASTPALSMNIGLVAPQNGPYALLGQQMRNGALAAADATGNSLTIIDESCTADSGAAIADKLIAAKVDSAIGFLCSESLEGGLAKLAASNIPVLTLSVRWPTIMEDALKQHWPFYRMAPSSKAESSKIVDVMISQWAGFAFALVDDGTIRGRELVDAIRAPLEGRGMKAVFTDTYRPGQEQQISLVRRLKKAGATHVFIGGDRADISIIARDAKAEAISLTLMGGDTMKAVDKPVALTDGVLAVTTPDYATLPAAQAAVGALRNQNLEPDGYTLPAYASVEFLNAANHKAAGKPLRDALEKTRVQTAIGTISFGADHDLADNPYQLLEWRDGAFHTPDTP
ncbi:branched-chain amino acid transport system substrate-binding protein [Agrobacterium vitis]|nr:branched-chain amino acid transport system substrate-binding protein [Agrobacterium vitis]MBE1437519.1 branched-chain amino acid transport system substrate-binding protein [Agrobacterium vitis]